MFRVKSVVLAVGAALEMALSPLAPASAVSAPLGRSSVWTRGREIPRAELVGRSIVIRKTLFGDAWRGRGRELA